MLDVRRGTTIGKLITPFDSIVLETVIRYFQCSRTHPENSDDPLEWLRRHVMFGGYCAVIRS